MITLGLYYSLSKKKKKKLAEQDYAKTISPPAITQKDE